LAGHFGKLVCGILSTRLGIIKSVAASEIITSAIVLGMAYAPLHAIWLLLIPLGVALNGTSSISMAVLPSYPARNSKPARLPSSIPRHWGVAP
jgi:cyanate permease